MYPNAISKVLLSYRYIGHTIAILMLGFKSEFSRTSNNRFSTSLENETLEDSSNLLTTGYYYVLEKYISNPLILFLV